MDILDFEAMSTPEDFERYFASTDDHSEFIRWMRRTGAPAPTDEVVVDAQGDTPMELTAVRLPKAMIHRLDELAGSDRAGRSG